VFIACVLGEEYARDGVCVFLGGGMLR
jgi:hypothetical protein